MLNVHYTISFIAHKQCVNTHAHTLKHNKTEKKCNSHILCKQSPANLVVEINFFFVFGATQFTILNNKSVEVCGIGSIYTTQFRRYWTRCDEKFKRKIYVQLKMKSMFETYRCRHRLTQFKLFDS